MQTTSRRHFLFGTFASALAAGALRAADTENLPAYHDHPPKGKVPETKDPAQYADNPLVRRVYELAGKIRPVLYQQPCYCSCDKFAGHGSLLDCFVDKHGEECAICQHEAVYSYIQHKAGKTAAQIRAGIVAGEWRQVDMSLSALNAL